MIPMRRLVLGFAFVAPFLSLSLLGTNIFLALGPLLASHLLVFYATLVANSQWWGPVIISFATTEREAWITIDDGPSATQTLQLLEVLERFHARATFFVIGAKAEQHPHLITEILARGHALANHTYTHPSASFWCAGAGRIEHEIDRGAETLRSTSERPAQFFRAPAGLKNPFVHPALARRGLRLIGWTVRGLDTVRRNPVKVAERIERGVCPGAIIVLHDGRQTSNEPDFSARCLELTLQRLQTRGYRFVIPRPEQLRTGVGGKQTGGC